MASLMRFSNSWKKWNVAGEQGSWEGSGHLCPESLHLISTQPLPFSARWDLPCPLQVSAPPCSVPREADL